MEQQGQADQEAAAKTYPEYSKEEVGTPCLFDDLNFYCGISKLTWDLDLQLQKHKTPETGIWVSYEGSVYDITNFVESHPGEEEEQKRW